MSKRSSQLVRQAAGPTQGHQDRPGPEPRMFNTPDHSLRASDLGNAELGRREQGRCWGGGGEAPTGAFYITWAWGIPPTMLLCCGQRPQTFPVPPQHASLCWEDFLLN